MMVPWIATIIEDVGGIWPEVHVESPTFESNVAWAYTSEDGIHIELGGPFGDCLYVLLRELATWRGVDPEPLYTRYKFRPGYAPHT